MKCPFLIVRKDVYDKSGKKIKEELELQDCIKNDCMVYDGATKLCSLLSSNMKTGVMIDDLKNGFKEVREDMQQRNESFNTVLSSTIQSLQEALLGRFDILKKQNEVMVLGFDRLVETIINKFEGLKSSFSDMSGSMTAIGNTIVESMNKNNDGVNTSLITLSESLKTQSSDISSHLQSLQHTIDEIRNAHIQFSEGAATFNEKVLGTIVEQGEGNIRVLENTGAKLDVIKQDIEKMTTISQVNMETVGSAIDRIVTSNQETAAKFDVLVNSVTNITDIIRSEIGGMRGEIGNATNSITAKLDALSTTLADTIKPGIDSMTELMHTEVAGLKTETISVLNGISTKFDQLSSALADTMKPGIDAMTDLFKTEVSGLKVETITALGNLSVKFDDLGRIFTNELSVSSTSLKTDINTLKESLVEKLDQISNAFSEIGKLQEQAVQQMVDKVGATMAESAKVQEQGLQNLITNFSNVGNGIRSDVTDLKTNTASVLEGFKTDIGAYIESVKLEITNLRTDQVTSMTNIQGAVVQLQELFKNSSDSLGSMSDMMKNLNSNYIESLSKIAGLAEGMRKGVAKVGEGMHDSVKDLVKEMKSEIGALEKQYEKTFGDIANLAGKFGDLNKHIKEMTKEVEKEFKDSFDRQEQLSNYTKTILEHIKSYFEKEEARYKEEQVLRHKKEGLDHFDRATLYYYRGNYELAVNEINKALEIETTTEYLNLKGLLFAELGKFDDSKKIYSEALKLEPNLAEIHNNLGLLYLKMKKLDDAVVAFQEAVKKNVNYALAYVNLGKAYIEREKYDDAIKAYEKALQIDPSNYEAQEAIKLYKEGKIGA